jgi:hypothetical protein
MAAANPLPPLLDDDLDVFSLDDLSHLSPELCAAIEAAELEGRAGRVVPQAKIHAGIEEMRRQQGG